MNPKTSSEWFRWMHNILAWLASATFLASINELFAGTTLVWNFKHIQYQLPTWNRLGWLTMIFVEFSIFAGTLTWLFRNKSSTTQEPSMSKNFFVKKSFIYIVFGFAFGISIFQAFFSHRFYIPNGLNFPGLIMATIVGMLSAAISAVVGRKLCTLDAEPDFWNFEVKRWVLPFIIVAIVVPAISNLIGTLLRESPLLIVGLIMCNTLLTPLAYCILTARISKNRLAHVCFSAILAWLIAAPLHLIHEQPLQLWFAAFPLSALLAITGYLAAQGTKAIRSHSVAL
ncbi:MULTISPECIES: hypothetical protein [Pandoraea]|uniref:hypothetical protein n=1 Tax=Pandoraea TaxID=93217 RepID=UPI001F5C8665|nr:MULTISPECIES: hypothetical protein [Pandoraea]